MPHVGQSSLEHELGRNFAWLEDEDFQSRVFAAGRLVWSLRLVADLRRRLSSPSLHIHAPAKPNELQGPPPVAPFPIRSPFHRLRIRISKSESRLVSMAVTSNRCLVDRCPGDRCHLDMLTKPRSGCPADPSSASYRQCCKRRGNNSRTTMLIIGMGKAYRESQIHNVLSECTSGSSAASFHVQVFSKRCLSSLEPRENHTC